MGQSVKDPNQKKLHYFCYDKLSHASSVLSESPAAVIHLTAVATLIGGSLRPIFKAVVCGVLNWAVCYKSASLSNTLSTPSVSALTQTSSHPAPVSLLFTWSVKALQELYNTAPEKCVVLRGPIQHEHFLATFHQFCFICTMTKYVTSSHSVKTWNIYIIYHIYWSLFLKKKNRNILGIRKTVINKNTLFIQVMWFKNLVK